MKHVSPLKPVVNRTPAHSPTPSVFNKTPTGSQGKEYAHLQEASVQVKILLLSAHHHDQGLKTIGLGAWFQLCILS